MKIFEVTFFDPIQWVTVDSEYIAESKDPGCEAKYLCIRIIDSSVGRYYQSAGRL